MVAFEQIDSRVPIKIKRLSDHKMSGSNFRTGTILEFLYRITLKWLKKVRKWSQKVMVSEQTSFVGMKFKPHGVLYHCSKYVSYKSEGTYLFNYNWIQTDSNWHVATHYMDSENVKQKTLTFYNIMRSLRHSGNVSSIIVSIIVI